jgi:hypothetical protein
VIKSIEISLSVAFFLAAAVSRASDTSKRPLVPSDCVTVKYLSLDNSYRGPVQFNPQGTMLAYLVERPMLQNNDNVVDLYAKNVLDDSPGQGRLLLSASAISQLQWRNDGDRLTVLVQGDGPPAVKEIQVSTGKQTSELQNTDPIVEYSIDRTADTLVFATETSSEASEARPSTQQVASGYRIPFQKENEQALFPRRMLFVVHRIENRWTRPEQIVIHSPFSKAGIDKLAYNVNLLLSLSPDGSKLLLRYFDSGREMPQQWKDSPFVNIFFAAGLPGVPLLVMYRLADRATVLPMNTPGPQSIPLWSNDSRFFAISAQSPVGSSWERDDIDNHRIEEGGDHLFSVDTTTGTVEEVIATVADTAEQALAWTEQGDLFVHTSADTVTAFAHRNSGWAIDSQTAVPLANQFRFAQLASNGQYIAGDYQNYDTPPELFLYKIGASDATIFARLNPEFDSITLASTKQVSWQLPSGYRIDGTLFLPPDYKPNSKYPLVIQARPDQGGFVCDSGSTHYPSFAPQPLANSGVAYLVRNYGKGWKFSDDVEQHPSGYSGRKGLFGVSEAAFQMDIWDAAVDSLGKQGLIDPHSVGIIGFSRTGWYTEFILSHSETLYRAATVSDNIEYSLGEYWLFHESSFMRASDNLYGGPPYGDSLQNWIKYSISFNAEKIRTPLLMEQMGYGYQYNDEKLVPRNLAIAFEVFTALSKLRKPVELYYYPNEQHQPDHPQARLASLQRNVDWFRFWLQAYQRPGIENDEQYSRWRVFREEQDMQGRGTNSGTKDR